MKGDEHIYNIPLRKAYLYKRTKRAIRAVKLLQDFVLRHAKTDKVIISMALNELIWSRSIQKPPRLVRVRVVKKDGTAYAYLPDEKTEEKKAEKPKEEKKAEEKEVKKPAQEKEEKKSESKEVKKEEKSAGKKPEEKKEKPEEPEEKKQKSEEKKEEKVKTK
ncbi:50S ribosomal protein L31e [Candidatus Micrarchaeota archaeon]|nr:50S ribosomal protein L31e [Candidatus Micrarchaeota archaeon]